MVLLHRDLFVFLLLLSNFLVVQSSLYLWVVEDEVAFRISLVLKFCFSAS